MSGIFMRFPGGRKKALTLSYDDGVEQDRRLMQIMDAHGLKGTFNLNSGEYAAEGTVYPKGQIHRRMSEKEATELYAGSGHEVAVHGLTHPFLEQLPGNVILQEVVKDRENLENQFHTVVRGMAYPFGTYNDQVVECLKMAGIAYSRTVESSHNFKIPTDWLRLPATCHHNDPKLMELAEEFVNEAPKRDSWMFYLWGHSYEYEVNDNWNVIEEFAAYAGGHEDIWYATNLQIYDYVQAYQRLEFSCDTRLVYNPSAIEIFLEKDGELNSVKPGETTQMKATV